MRAAGRKANQHIPHLHRSAGDQLLLLHHTNAEPGEVVFAAAIEPRHLRRLAPCQRAARQLATPGDASNHPLGDIHIQCPGGVVVEKQKRLRSAHQHVVGAHRDEVLPHGVMPIVFEGELELGAHPICARNQKRLSIPRRQGRDRGKPPETAPHLRPMRFPNGPGNATHKIVARIHIDPSIAIRERHAAPAQERKAKSVRLSNPRQDRFAGLPNRLSELAPETGLRREGILPSLSADGRFPHWGKRAGARQGRQDAFPPEEKKRLPIAPTTAL